jgi:hypothetical protein
LTRTGICPLLWLHDFPRSGENSRVSGFKSPLGHIAIMS